MRLHKPEWLGSKGVEQLKGELALLGLSTLGNKEELYKRLESQNVDVGM